MQPYFIPYAGYFRLFAAADLFVVYDCVQFPRRGYVHRNKLTNDQGVPEWVTLPLKKSARDTTRICDLEFATDAVGKWPEHLQKFPVLASGKYQSPVKDAVLNIGGNPPEYIVNILKLICAEVAINFNIAYSSALKIPDALRAEERILFIAKHFGATEYINSPGGRALYDEKNFANNGIKLKFLPDYHGNKISILERLLTENKKTLREEILSQI